MVIFRDKNSNIMNWWCVFSNTYIF